MSLKRIIVIGGGIGGLCTAVFLRQSGFDVTVYEQAAALGRVGAGLSLWPNALHVLAEVGLADAVQAAGTAMQQVHIRRADGGILSGVDLNFLAQKVGRPVVAIHRADLHRVLLDALPSDVVHLGSQLVKLEDNGTQVTVHLGNGRSDSADLVIGADGINSAVRQQLWPDIGLRYAGYPVWRGIAPATANNLPPATGFETMGQGARFGMLPVGEQHVYWYATVNHPANTLVPVAQKRPFLQRIFGDWHDPIPALLAETPLEAILQNDVNDLLPFRPWHKGRVVLVGDAVHAMTPNMGQGACQAIESGRALAHYLSRGGDLVQNLAAYEAYRVDRAAKMMQESWINGRVAQLDNRLACQLRNLVLKALPDSVGLRRFESAVAIPDLGAA